MNENMNHANSGVPEIERFRSNTLSPTSEVKAKDSKPGGFFGRHRRNSSSNKANVKSPMLSHGRNHSRSDSDNCFSPALPLKDASPTKVSVNSKSKIRSSSAFKFWSSKSGGDSSQKGSDSKQNGRRRKSNAEDHQPEFSGIEEDLERDIDGMIQTSREIDEFAFPEHLRFP